jgi:phenylacetate-coenzyme A ligase PaaK-like adenylate-forming protein
MTDTITAFLAALAQTERLAPDRLRLYQRGLLERLVRHARAETDFYRERLDPLFRTDDSIDWERWRSLPILTRAEAVDNFAALTARSLSPVAGKAIEDITSGSTGTAFRHYRAGIQNTASACANERFLRWHGLDPAALTAFIRVSPDAAAAYPDGQMRTGWRLGHPESREATLAINGISIERQIEWLNRIRPTFLMSYPSNLSEIARVAERTGVGFDLQAVMTFGEVLSEDARLAIREFFGCDPLDRYGATETGVMAAACPHSLKYHVMAELVLMEILDAEGAPTASGVPGRVIVTPFYNHAMPLIRYEIGDYAVPAAEPCGCGRSLPTLESVRGRARNIFRFNDGSSLWPVIGARALQRFVPHRQYQLVQLTLDQLELRYVPAAADQSNDVDGLTTFLRGRLHPSVVVTLVAVNAIGRSSSGKYEDCVSLVG